MKQSTFSAVMANSIKNLWQGYTKSIRFVAVLMVLLTMGIGEAWGAEVLFHETFGNNSSSARAWKDSYSVKSGVSEVYTSVTYTMSNLRQSKNTVGCTQSGLLQTTAGTDASIIIGPLNVSNYEDLELSFMYKAGSVKNTYKRSAQYKTSSNGTWKDLSVNGTQNASTCYEQVATLPDAAEGIETLYIKIIFNTSNTQATIDEVEVTGTKKVSCTAPTSVSVSGEWGYFGGEKISLTATPSGGSGTYTYQWKLNGVNISGATSATYTKTNCTVNDGGTYTCVVSTGASCSTEGSFDVKVYALQNYTGGTTTYNFTREGTSKKGTVEVPLSGNNTSYEFKIFAGGSQYFGNSGTINADIANWDFESGKNNVKLNSELGGTFTFVIDYTNNGSVPKISVTYPRKTIYLNPGVWDTDGAKYAIYYFIDESNKGWSDLLVGDACGTYTTIPQWNGVTMIAVRLSSDATGGTWDKKWNQTDNIAVTDNDYITITGWGNNSGNSPYTYSTYTPATYSITFNGNGSTGGSMTKVTGITCGGSATLTQNAFTRTGYTFAGWATTADGDVAHTDKATISNITSNITLYAKWTPNANTAYTVKHYKQQLDGTYSGTPDETDNLTGTTAATITPAVKSYEGFTAPSTTEVTIAADGKTVVEYYYTRNSYTLTWDVNEGNDLTGEYTSGSVKFGATITKPADPTRAGYNFSGWHNGTAIVTPATTMPADNLTYTAQWKERYTVTWLVEGQPYTIGNPTTTVEEGQNITAIPSDPPLLTCAVKFMGWSIESSGSTPEDPSYYSDLFTTLDEAEVISINEDMTFHAVFATNAETIEGAGTEWVKTELSAVTEGTYALLTTDGYAFNGSINSGHGQVTTNAFSFTDNIATSAPDGTCEITFEAVSGGFKMYNANKGYLYAKDNSSGKLAWHTEETSYWYSNKYSSNNWTYDANDAVLRSYNNGSIRTYSGNTGNLLVLAKKTTSSTTVFTAFITSCCETEAPTDGSIDGVKGSGNAMSVTLHWKDANDYKRYHVVCDELGIDEYVEEKTDFETEGVLSECTTYIFKVSSAPDPGCESPVLEIETTPFIPKTITFDDGTTTTTQTTSCKSKTVIVPTPTAQNCSTYVWKDEATGTEYTDGQTITPANDMTIVAKWSVETYTITFNDWDGTQLQQSIVECGQKPAYNGETPTRPEDNKYKYIFAGWDPSIKEADGNQTYTATYTQTQHQITVIWMVNGEEYILGDPSTTVSAGEKVAKLPTPPSPDDYCGQVFAGWTDQPIDGAPIADAPAVLFNTPETSPTLYKEGDKTTVTFYAVFADIKE